MHWKEIGIGILAGAALMAVSFFAGVNSARKGQEGGIKVKVDTLLIRDTITLSKPIYLSREVIRVDTLMLHDTIKVEIPIERRVYADSNYRAVVSGWKPSLDSISVYPATKIVTIDRERIVNMPISASRWSVGIQGGYGIGKAGLTPHIGIGVQYRLFGF